MARGPAVSALAAVLERRCPALPAAAEGAKLQTSRFQTMWRAAQCAVARQQVQHRVPWRLMANGDFETVGHALSSSAFTAALAEGSVNSTVTLSLLFLLLTSLDAHANRLPFAVLVGRPVLPMVACRCRALPLSVLQYHHNVHIDSSPACKLRILVICE